MQLFRNVDRSLYDQISSLLTSPPGGFTNSFHVYGEDKFTDTSFRPVFPFVWLMGYRVPPRISRLPMLIIDSSTTRQSYFELGNREGNLAFVVLSIFAKTRGERDDFAAFFREYLFDVPIYDYTTTTLLFHAQVEGFIAQRIPVGEDIGMDGALNNAVACSFVLQTLK